MSLHSQIQSEEDSEHARVNVPGDTARAFAETLLQKHGVSVANARVIAHGLVAADLRGIDTHGVNRLIPYIKQVKNGVLRAAAEPEYTSITPVVGQVDGNYGFGFVAAKLGIQKACEMAATYGIGMVSVKHSNHFGMSAWIVQEALDYREEGKVEGGLMSLVFTNSSPAMPVWGGREQLLGVSPIACGAPGGPESRPFILDMAPSVAARGKVHKALRRGEKIPEGWALDAEGNTTTDPAEALKGVMLPMGGPKGSGLAIMMDVFSGVLSGSAFAGGVTGPYDPSKPSDVGHFFVAIKPDLFMSLEDFRNRMQISYDKVVNSEKAKGVERIYFPGELEQITSDERTKNGIPYTKHEIQTLNEEAEKAGASPLTAL